MQYYTALAELPDNQLKVSDGAREAIDAGDNKRVAVANEVEHCR